MRIFVTGGAGYVGSHTALALLLAGHDIHVLDNYSNSSPEALRRIARLAGGRAFGQTEGDIRDEDLLARAISDVPTRVRRLDYPAFVELTLRYAKVNSWL
ncbi:MAG: GDP-mannose 4,6-dehydratase [Pseudomonas sp.]|nr:GDP-mannose 4,6-dehydratase [Pseudomonas sp.]